MSPWSFDPEKPAENKNAFCTGKLRVADLFLLLTLWSDEDPEGLLWLYLVYFFLNLNIVKLRNFFELFRSCFFFYLLGLELTRTVTKLMGVPGSRSPGLPRPVAVFIRWSAGDGKNLRIDSVQRQKMRDGCV